MNDRSEEVETARLVAGSQGLAREAYPVRYVDRDKPRTRDQTGS
jgi:hypothetical protein